MGGPKALLRAADGRSYVVRALEALGAGGCDDVVVVVGAAADEVRAELAGSGADVVVARQWEEGMGESLRAGLSALAADADACLVSLVDLPDVDAKVVARLLSAGSGADSLARASYDGRPGHPVLLGRRHWAEVVASSGGDRGARDYLAAHRPALVECGDLATGRDVDRPGDLGGAPPAG